MNTAERLFYVTSLSNLIRGYDKYSRRYDKSRIPESSFPDRFFLVCLKELRIGIGKASHLPQKTGLHDDRLIAIETQAHTDELRPNLGTGLGRYIERSHIDVHAVHFVDRENIIDTLRIEEACAQSLRVLALAQHAYDDLAPLSVSLLPVALACQARCPFCFSKASVSADQESARPDWDLISMVLREGRARGAARAVITGGGEPSLLPDADLPRMVRLAATVFPKVVLISNGFKWAQLNSEGCKDALRDLDRAGLSVLALSRHHDDAARNSAIMNLDTGSERIARSWVELGEGLTGLSLRWICVLQRGGIEDRDSLERYLEWAVKTGVDEVCFKELYVSTSVESEYHDREANDWSFERQVPLRLVLDLARDESWTLIRKLPWGSPVFETIRGGRRLRVAAYTEPSLLWELTNGVCRSWNLMADGRCLASLEDRHSEVTKSGLRKFQTLP
jgi:molybdenum cofactor biosynthesis enzyme MoaA